MSVLNLRALVLIFEYLTTNLSEFKNHILNYLYGNNILASYFDNAKRILFRPLEITTIINDKMKYKMEHNLLFTTYIIHRFTET